MEDWVDLPVGRNVEVQGHVRYHFLDLKWSSFFSFGVFWVLPYGDLSFPTTPYLLPSGE